MAKKLYEENNIQGIANAIREKNGSQNVYTVAQMGNAVRAIHTPPNLEVLNVTNNGNYLPSAGKEGFSEVNVNVSSPSYIPIIQPLNIDHNGIYPIPSGVDGFGPVTVNVSGSSSTLIGTDPPSNNIGNIGDYYIQEFDSQTYMFGIAITAAGRDSDYNFTYWGARDIQIVFDDGNSNEVLLKDLSVKSCKYANGNSNFILQNGNIDGLTNSYYEHNGLPGYYCIECEIPQTYLLKALKIYPRSSWHDYWRTFTFAEWSSFKVPFGSDLVSEANLEYSDWIQNDYNVFNLGNIKPKMAKTVNIYYKYSDGWMLIK